MCEATVYADQGLKENLCCIKHYIGDLNFCIHSTIIRVTSNEAKVIKPASQ